MDWFSWLSRTNLHPAVTYDYGVTFVRNELRPEDAAFFNHEFLQSMGISIAKHRLEILKLAKKENGATKKLSGVLKRCLRKCMSKLVTRQDTAKLMPPEPDWTRGSLKEEKPKIKPISMPNRTRTIALSGPLDGRAHEKLINSSNVLRLSGPLDGRMVCTNRSPMIPRPVVGSVKSPRLSGPLDSRLTMSESRSPWLTRASDAGVDSPYYNGMTKLDYDCDDESTNWPALFQDLKPT